MRKNIVKILLIVSLICFALSQYCFAQSSLEISPSDGFILEMDMSAPKDTVDFRILNAEPDPVSLALSVESTDSTYIIYLDAPDSNSFYGNIWKMRPDGSDKMQITSDTLDNEPRWSPDGSKVVFYSLRSGNDDVWVMDADGSNMVNLTIPDTSADRYPSWSPDGQHIIFNSDRDHYRLEVYRMTATGDSITRLTNNTFLDLRPEYSPDGQHFVIQSKPAGSHYEICVYESDGSSFVNIGAPGVYWDYQPSWMPFGQRVLWVSGDPSVGGLNIVSNNIDGTDFQTEFSLPENIYIPKSSPDGQFIAFSKATFSSMAGDDIYVWNRALDSLSQITDSTEYSSEWGPDWSPFLNAPTWLSLSQTSIQLNAGDSADVEIPIDFTGFSASLYTASVMIFNSSDILLATVPLNVFFGVPMSEDEEVEFVQNAYLASTYPNPIKHNTIINYSLKESGFVTLSIYNMKGQFVTNLVNEEKQKGKYVTSWDGKDEQGFSVKNGIYLYTLNTGNGKVVAKRMVVLR